MQSRKFLALALFAPVIFSLFAARPAQAYSIIQVPGVAEIGDFILDQGKTEVALSPGEKSMSQVSVTNRSKDPVVFKVTVEDFSGSKSTDQNLVFYGAESSPYSLKNYLKPEIAQFTLNHGEKIILPVAIEIPANAVPGGLYGAVIITAEPKMATVQNSTNQIQVIPRLASLYFVRIKGDAAVAGSLKSFSGDKMIYDRPTVDFKLLYENTGTVFIAPTGKIVITNLIGRTVGQIDIPGFYVMPDSVRQLKNNFKNSFMFGYYTAKLSLSRGYGSEIDSRSVGFWVLPWQLTLSILAGLIIFGWIIERIIKSFRR